MVNEIKNIYHKNQIADNGIMKNFFTQNSI